MNGPRPSAYEIMYSLQPKQGFGYPVWQRPFFVLILLGNLHGPCHFHLELRLETLDDETVVQQTQQLTVDVGNIPLHVQPISVMIKPTELLGPSVYQLCLVWNEETLARATIHAR